MNAKNYFCYPQSYMSLSQIKEFYFSLPPQKKEGFCLLIQKKGGKYHVSMFSFGLNPPSPIKRREAFKP